MTRFVGPLLLLLALVFGGLACGTIGSSSADQAQFSQPEALLYDLGVTESTEFAVFDRGRGELLWFDTNGQLQTTEAVAAPTAGWGATPPRLWRDVGGRTVFAAQVSGPQLAVGATDGGVLKWETWPSDATVVPVHGAVSVTTGTAAIATGLTLPADAAAWPESVTDLPFVYLATDGRLAAWDPVTGAPLWRMSADAMLAAATTDTVAWVSQGRLHATGWTVEGPVDVTATVPLPAAVIRMRFGPGGRLWLSAADGGLYQVAWRDERTLCLVDNVDGGASTSTPLFIDHGALSSPSLRFLRVGLDDCPGWARDDVLNITYEGVPDGWSGVVAAAVTRWTDLPMPLTGTTPEWLWFEGSDGTTAVAAVAPSLTWIPSPPAVTGVIRPLDRWVWTSARSGLIALAPTGQTVEIEGWGAIVDPGIDPADRHDRFTVTIDSSVDTFTAATVFSDFMFLAQERIAALDRRDNSLTLIDVANTAVYGGIR